MNDKNINAYKTIGEVAKELNLIDKIKNHKKKKNIWFTKPGEISDYVYKKKINKTN